MDTGEHTLVEREVTIPASRQLVWDAWTDPVRIVTWMGSSAQLEPTPGTDVRIAYANGAVVQGSMIEAQPPARLVFTWGWEDPAEAVRPGASRVEVAFDEVAGGTRVLVRHLDLPEAERESHAEGWDYFLGRLADELG